LTGSALALAYHLLWEFQPDAERTARVMGGCVEWVMAFESPGLLTPSPCDTHWLQTSPRQPERLLPDPGYVAHHRRAPARTGARTP
jgi:hypothetical protein